MIDLANKLLGTGVIVLQIGTVVGVVLLLMFRKGHPLIEGFSQWAITAGFVITFGATLSSLFYSVVAGFPPCDLCWYQRVFLYPLFILFGIGAWKRDRNVLHYVFGLAIPGILTALYHNYVYYGGRTLLPCSAYGLGASCTNKYVFEFGYITIPLMSLTVFAAVIVIALLGSNTANRKISSSYNAGAKQPFP